MENRKNGMNDSDDNDNGEDAFREKVARRLAEVGGVLGVVLGGSRARGTHGSDSDYDFGVYYRDEDALDLDALTETARALDDERRENLIAPPGGWGKWVNGGGWLVVDGRHVDIILRDFRRVEQAVADCRAGKAAPHYQTGHPHAFVDAVYAGELSVAAILADHDGVLRELREKTIPYPEALGRVLNWFFSFEAGFSLQFAQASIARGDDYYVAAHAVRSLSCLNQVLFALNREYCLNEKKAVAMIDGFARKPERYGARVKEVVALLGADNSAACRALQALVDETRALPADESQ